MQTGPYPYQDYVAGLKQALDLLPFQVIDHVVELLDQARREGRQVFVFGNGGSASTATHMACDLGKNTIVPGMPRLRVLSLNDNVALFSALSNDCGYENVFAEQLSSLVQRGDIVVAISASGNSPNVLKAIALAKDYGAITVGMSGYNGGKLAKMVDHPIVVQNHCIEQIEDIHLMVEHMMTSALRQRAQVLAFASN
ncbi:MAG: SIS domain-containing protein [Anaerolineales bacterium]|nr:SIS domain-containing protein [Anaerolineales bacterium]